MTKLPPKWIALNLKKRECGFFIPMPGDDAICQCGRRKIDHGDFVKLNNRAETWSPLIHTKTFPTDSYGTILFEGEHHPNKASYARLSFDTNPEQIMHLLRYVWGLPMPKLVISVHGGGTNFDLSSRLGKVFQSGIINVSQTTSAWVLSNGLNSGVSKHLGNALNHSRWFGGIKHRQVVSIGIAPWGMCEHRNDLLGRNKDRVYCPLEIHNSNMIHLNSRHSNFLLVDNGSIGRIGGETFLRRKLEKCISTYSINQNSTINCPIPVVVIVMEGGGHTLRIISEYLYDEPPTPIVLFAGSGKVTDLVAWMIKRFQNEEELFMYSDELMCKIGKIFRLDVQAAAEVFQELRQIYQRKFMITVYHGNSASEKEFETVILSSVFRSKHWSPLEQLELTLVWDRVDLAQNEVFVYGREWNRGHLEEAMMEALISNRLEFVQLLMEHGINMKTFLTVDRLEKLYSTAENSKIMGSLLMEFSELRRISKRRRKLDSQDRHLSLSGVGAALVQMGVYRPDYLQIKPRIIQDNINVSSNAEEKLREQRFPQPFDDIFIWAILTKRHDLAKLLWCHGQGSLAKALVAVILNTFFAEELAKMNVSQVREFEHYRDEWKKFAFSLLDSCYRQDFILTRQLLTMGLKNWSQQNCLTLAVKADHKTLLGHPCCQILLADLWMGALNLKTNSMFKITLSSIIPVFAFCLHYKSTEELKLFSNQDPDKRHIRNSDDDDDDNYGLMMKKHDQDVIIPESESSNTFTNYRNSTNSIIKHLRSKYKFGRKTNIAEVASSLQLGKSSNIKKVEVGVSSADESFQIRVTGVELPQNGHSFPNVVVERKPLRQHSASLHNKNDKGGNSSGDHKKVDSAKPTNRLSRFVTTRQTLSGCQKFIESQRAPIANFIRHFFGYLIFICCLWYVILYNQDPKFPGIVEFYVIACVLSHGLECIYEFIAIDALTFSKKLAEMKENTWRLVDFFLVLFFLSGTTLRFIPGHFENTMTIYRTSSIYWNLRIYKYLAAHRFIGPKLLMMTKMFEYMTCFAMIILVVIFAFAIARQSIRSPYTDPTWSDINPSFLEPYVMMFGEVSTLEEAINIECIDDPLGNTKDCPLGSSLIPVFWVIYMMVSNILIVNVLIAVFNGIYEEIDSKSVEIWMSQQFLVVMEFGKKPLLPPPFIIISYIISFCHFVCSKCHNCMCSEELLDQGEDDGPINVILGNDHNFKVFLGPAEQGIVFNFEEENVDLLRHILITDKEGNGKGTPGASIFNTTDTAYRAGTTSEKTSPLHQIKKNLQELCGELETQRLKIDRLIEYWELEEAIHKDKNAEEEQDDDDNEISTSDSYD